MKNFLTYFFMPGIWALMAAFEYHRKHYFAAFVAGFYFASWVWNYPWFVIMVIKSLLGIY